MRYQLNGGESNPGLDPDETQPVKLSPDTLPWYLAYYAPFDATAEEIDAALDQAFGTTTKG